MTHEKNIIYSNIEYNKYMTDDRNLKLGGIFPNFVIIIIAIKQLYIVICL